MLFYVISQNYLYEVCLQAYEFYMVPYFPMRRFLLTFALTFGIIFVNKLVRDMA